MAGPSAIEISATVEADVRSGQLRPGQQLPSVRDRAAELGVSPTTVAAAYRRLRERGVVVGRGRQGTRVAPRAHPPALHAAPVPAGLVDARSGNPDPAFLPPLGPALAHAAAGPPARYGGPLVDDELAAVARRLFAADGIDATHLAVTSGSMDAIERVIAALDLRTGDRIGVEDPGHIPVHQLARSAGLDVVPLPVDEEGIIPGALRTALDRGLTAVVVTPRAQNPTGAALTPARAAALDGLLAAHPAVAVIQDDHAGPVSGADHVGLTPPGPRWATIRALGKVLGPDLRLALVAADAATIGHVSTSVANGPGWISHLLQRAAAHLLTDPATSDLVRAAAASYRGCRERLIAALAKQGTRASGPSGINVWVPVDDEQAAVEAARAAGCAVRAADPYRISSPPAIRVTVAGLTDADIDGLARALARDPEARRTSQAV
ncbi:MAG: aminotransferase class I/II-fold pyridoxal phosphate-dependent enzyme [Iamia sp.]